MVDREELLNEYVGEVLNGLDLDVVYSLAWESLRRDMDTLDTDELIQEVTEFYPHLLSDDQ